MNPLRTTPERIAELRALAEKATPGPWLYFEYEMDGATSGERDTVSVAELHLADRVADADGITDHVYLENGNLPRADMAFIAAARTAVPDLIADNADLTAENERLRAELAAMTERYCNEGREAGQLRLQLTAADAEIARLETELGHDIATGYGIPFAARADTAEAALKAGHAGEVTDAMALEAMIKALELDEEYSPKEARRLIVQGKDTPHDGDCTKRPYTCVRCVYEDAITRGRAILSAALAVAPTPSDLAPGLRRAAKIAEARAQRAAKHIAKNESYCVHLGLTSVYREGSANYHFNHTRMTAEGIARDIRAEIGDAS